MFALVSTFIMMLVPKVVVLYPVTFYPIALPWIHALVRDESISMRGPPVII